MTKKTLIIDIAKCSNCNNCFMACKDEFVDNDFLPHSIAQPKHNHNWIEIKMKERGQFPLIDVGHLPHLCMQCKNAPCIAVAQNGAMYRRKDGTIMIDPIKAQGQKQIVDACPYGVISWNETQNVPQKCTLCSHLLDEGWSKPRCVQACPTGALSFVDEESPEYQQLKQSGEAEPYRPDLNTKPRVLYKNLHHFTKHFIAGNVVVKESDECAVGAKISLSDASGQVLGTYVSDNFGDFKLDKIESGQGPFQLEIAYGEFREIKTDIVLNESITIGTVLLG